MTIYMYSVLSSSRIAERDARVFPVQWYQDLQISRDFNDYDIGSTLKDHTTRVELSLA